MAARAYAAGARARQMREDAVDELRQALYLIADEMRGMATVGRTFAGNIYEVERAHRIMGLAARIAALAEGRPEAELLEQFTAEPWHRVSPAIGAEAAVFNERGELLLVQRRDNAHWCIPGGLAEIGRSPAESALLELWEEAGLRGRTARLLGVFDGRRWGSRAKVHMLHFVFLVECDDLTPAPGVEALDAAFFARDRLPEPLQSGHAQRIPKVFELLGAPEAYYDPARADELELTEHQRGGAGEPPAQMLPGARHHGPIVGLDHVQLAMPPGGEEQARAFYGGLLGMAEIPKPEPLAARGGCWFEAHGVQLHLGVEEPFVPARKAHPALRVADLERLRAALQSAGVALTPDEAVPGVRRFYVTDPFGNRIECIQDGDGFSQTRR